MFDGQMWALAVFMLGLIGILYHARTSKLTLDKQSERPNQK